MKHLLSLATLLICISCVSSSQSELRVIPVKMGSVVKKNLSEITDSLRTVELEFTDQSMITDFLKLVLFDDNHIVVWDRKTGVMLFDSLGKFIRLVGKRGEGPGEYKQISRVTVDFDQQYVYIACSRSSKLMCYDFKGQFLKETTFPTGVMCLFFNQNTLYGIIQNYTSEDNNTIHSMFLTSYIENFTRIDSIPLKTVRNANQLFGIVHDHLITKHDNQLNLYYFELNPEPSLRDTLFRLEEMTLIPELRLDFGTSRLDARGEPNIHLYNIFQSNRYVFGVFGCSPDFIDNFFCYDKQTRESHIVEKGYTDDYLNSGIANIRPILTNTNQYYFLAPREDMEELNPTLCIGTFKQ